MLELWYFSIGSYELKAVSVFVSMKIQMFAGEPACQPGHAVPSPWQWTLRHCAQQGHTGRPPAPPGGRAEALVPSTCLVPITESGGADRGRESGCLRLEQGSGGRDHDRGPWLWEDEREIVPQRICADWWLCVIFRHAVLGVLCMCFVFFFICICSAQLSMFRMERRSGNTVVIIIITVMMMMIFVPLEDLWGEGEVTQLLRYLCVWPSSRCAGSHILILVMMLVEEGYTKKGNLMAW